MSLIMSVFRKFFNVVYLIFKYIFKGLFKLFDVLFTIVGTSLVYLFVGLKSFFVFLFKIFKVVLYPFFHEIYIFIYSMVVGFVLVLQFIVYIFPRFVITNIINFFKFLYNKIKRFLERIGIFFKELPINIKNYFVKKYESLTIVKNYRKKKEQDLQVLFIDKNSKDVERSEAKHTYKYTARNAEGKLISGYFSALSRLDTYSYLIDEGYEVYEIVTNKWIDFVHGESQYINHKMKIKDLIFWLTQLSTYVKSGIPLTDSVKILASQNHKKSYKHVYDSIIYELTMGESFSDALRKQGNVFPALLINMMKAAEMIGDIEGTLDEMAEYYEEIEDTKRSVRSAMTYPSIILVFALGVVTFILIYIIPQFENVFAQSNMELPQLTATIIRVSYFLKNNYTIIVLFIIATICLFIVFYKNIKAFRSFIQYTMMHLPVVGKILIYKEITLFSKTFSSLNKNNILLTESMEILGKITNNEIYKTLMFDTINNLLKGDKMSISFKGNWAVPELAYHMITTGESTGDLALMLEKVSNYYQKEEKRLVNTIKTFIEPVMIAILAVIVGGIVISVVAPMTGMWGGIL